MLACCRVESAALLVFSSGVDPYIFVPFFSTFEWRNCHLFIFLTLLSTLATTVVLPLGRRGKHFWGMDRQPSFKTFRIRCFR